MFYPTLTNIPADLPRSPGSDREYSRSLEFCSRRWRHGESWSLLTSFAHSLSRLTGRSVPHPEEPPTHARGHSKLHPYFPQRAVAWLRQRVGEQTTVVWSDLGTDAGEVSAWVLEVGFRLSGQGIPDMYLGHCQGVGT